MAAVNLSNSPITQVSQTQTPVQNNLQPQLLTRLLLDLRGKRFTVERENILSLPESVLLCLFPNGLVLSRQSAALSDGGNDDDYEELYGVDFDPECFDYVLNFFQHAREDFYGTTANPGGLLAAQQSLLEGSSPTSDFGPSPSSQNPLLSKQAIIVLREELEYFSIPPRNGEEATDARGIANDALLDLKKASGRYLLHKRNIFTALQRNVNKENNLAEQHLIDMLCMSGFDREDEWGYRAMEPSRCCISSIALVLLKTGIVHSSNAAGERQVTVDYNQMATAQKLLLFWRKPARKCWWDGIEVDVAEPGEQARIIKLWARRVWTLELSLVRLHGLSSRYGSLTRPHASSFAGMTHGQARDGHSHSACAFYMICVGYPDPLRMYDTSSHTLGTFLPTRACRRAHGASSTACQSHRLS
ncbi:phosphatase activator [Epithele typhae]|uniref:phosphatase activator n=1 Tax=Epithele typhae TaxID=378194 RepID=UPI0020077CB0|nr:phosphatase activator [Epithele typhae]KAH9940020.1 phosphatase activator [Epithele typhae]